MKIGSRTWSLIGLVLTIWFTAYFSSATEGTWMQAPIALTSFFVAGAFLWHSIPYTLKRIDTVDEDGDTDWEWKFMRKDDDVS